MALSRAGGPRGRGGGCAFRWSSCYRQGCDPAAAAALAKNGIAVESIGPVSGPLDRAHRQNRAASSPRRWPGAEIRTHSWPVGGNPAPEPRLAAGHHHIPYIIRVRARHARPLEPPPEPVEKQLYRAGSAVAKPQSCRKAFTTPPTSSVIWWRLVHGSRHGLLSSPMVSNPSEFDNPPARGVFRRAASTIPCGRRLVAFYEPVANSQERVGRSFCPPLRRLKGLASQSWRSPARIRWMDASKTWKA